jgi:DNA-binding transcriptional MerR regulator
MVGIDDSVLSGLERQHAAGLTSNALIDLCGAHGIPLSEATLRKYVQLGLLPRSTRVGQKGKHQGSHGVYPVHVFRALLRIREMLAESYTIEEIRRDFLFARNELEQFEHILVCLFKSLTSAVERRNPEEGSQLMGREVKELEKQARQLLTRLRSMEGRLMRPARGGRAGVAPEAAKAS